MELFMLLLQFKIPECRLSDDFQTLLDNPVYSDVTLVCAQREFPVHKAILSARSKVFQGRNLIMIKLKYFIHRPSIIVF